MTMASALEEQFRKSIEENPDDDFPRKVYADWLDEHGREDEACRVRGVVPDVLTGYAWTEAFGYAGEPGTNAEEAKVKPAIPGDGISLKPFARCHVRRVIAHSEGENDERSWLCVGQLHDGRFFALKAGCDYTGWD